MPRSQVISPPATDSNFDEVAYLAANPDVREAVERGGFASGRHHFESYGRAEHRKMASLASLDALRRDKMERLRPWLRDDLACVWRGDVADYLTPELRALATADETDNVSSHSYDAWVLEVVEGDGLVLDCGAGSRDVYFDNVVNFEIAPYPSTDVLGVGEVLPFKDETFDAVISVAVLEHVRQPWLAAKEIIRVLKPGGQLRCCVPFLQPRHGYPHHYFNMTEQGLGSLFAADLVIDRQDVMDGLHPIVSLSWILNWWLDGLPGEARARFLDMKVSDLAGDWMQLINQDFCRRLSDQRRFDLASGTYLWATKPRT